MIAFTDNTLDQLTERQRRAVATLLRHACSEEYRGTTPDAVIVYTVEVKRTSYGTAWVYIRPDIPALAPGNMLRVLTTLDTWHVHVGKRGKLEAASYPSSLDQFAGDEWCGIHIERKPGAKK